MILLDANALVWWMNGDKRLGANTRLLLADSETPLCFSLLSLFELELKIDAGKLRFFEKPIKFLDRFGVSIYSPTASEISNLLLVHTGHNDPFDRALVGLGVIKGWNVLTSDERLLALEKLTVKIIDSRW